MSIDTVSDLPPRVQYVASAAQEDFDYTFPIFDDADISFVVDGVPASLGTDYTVAGVGDDTGGTITWLGTAFAGGEIVTISRSTVIERDTDIAQNGPWSSRLYNDEQDKIFLILQELKAASQRCLRIPVDAEVDDDDIELDVATWANTYVTIDANGKPTPAVLSSTTMTQAIVGQLLFPRTAEEIAASVTPVNYAYKFADLRRYGGVGDDLTDNSTPFTNAMLAIQNGGELFIATGTYRTSTAVVIPGTGVSLRGEGMWKSVIKYTGSAGSIIKPSTYASSFQYINVRDLAVQPANSSDIAVDFKSISSGVVERVRVWGGTSFASRMATGVRLSAASNSCYQNMIVNCDLEYLTEGVAVEDEANENRILGGAILSCTDGIKTRGTVSDNLRVAFVRIENCDDAIDIHDFRYFLILGCRFEKNANGTRGVVVAGGSTSFPPLKLQSNSYASYSAGNDIVTTGLTGRIDTDGENANQYLDLATTGGGWHLGLAKLFVGNPSAAGAGIIQVESSDTNADLTLTPKGTGAVATGSGIRGNGLTLTGATPTGTGSQVSIGNTVRATVGGAGGASALPATPSGYLEIDVAGTKRQIPYYPIS